MSLNKINLENKIIEVFVAEQSKTSDPNQSVKNIAKGLANAIDEYIKEGIVIVQVTTAGTATNQAGTGTGNIT